MITVFSYMCVGWLTVWLVDWMARYMGDDSLAADDDGFIMFIVTLWPAVLGVIVCYLLYKSVYVFIVTVKQFKSKKV